MEENLLMLMLHRCQEWVSMILITSRTELRNLYLLVDKYLTQSILPIYLETSPQREEERPLGGIAHLVPLISVEEEPFSLQSVFLKD